MKQKNSHLSKISTIGGPKMAPPILEIGGENDFLPTPISRMGGVFFCNFTTNSACFLKMIKNSCILKKKINKS